MRSVLLGVTKVLTLNGKTTHKHRSRLIYAVIQVVVSQKISELAPPVGITNSLGINGGFQLENAGMKQIAFQVMNVTQRTSEMLRAQ